MPTYYQVACRQVRRDLAAAMGIPIGPSPTAEPSGKNKPQDIPETAPAAQSTLVPISSGNAREVPKDVQEPNGNGPTIA